MRLKNNINNEHFDPENMEFWYDLSLGGYIKPENFLDSEADIQKVKEAVEVLKEFEQLLETIQI